MTRKSWIFLALIILFLGSTLVLRHVYASSSVVEVPEDETTDEPQYVTIQDDIIISGETLKKAIVDIGEIATAEYTFEHQEIITDPAILPIFGTELEFFSAKYTFVCTGHIKAGIKDYSDIDVTYDEESKTYSFSLPEAEILDKVIDENSFAVLENKENIFHKITATDALASLESIKEEETATAIADGLLEQAKNNAEASVENIASAVLTAAGIENFTIEFVSD